MNVLYRCKNKNVEKKRTNTIGNENEENSFDEYMNDGGGTGMTGVRNETYATLRIEKCRIEEHVTLRNLPVQAKEKQQLRKVSQGLFVWNF